VGYRGFDGNKVWQMGAAGVADGTMDEAERCYAATFPPARKGV
jgi:hypothetical protein